MSSSPTMGMWECRHGVDGRDFCDQCAAPVDAPEPSTPPATAGYGVLGRALLDSDGDVWPNDGDGYQAASENSPVRDVLLVSPAAGRVLEAARQWRESVPADLSWPARAAALAAAVDALGGDHPQGMGEAISVIKSYSTEGGEGTDEQVLPQV